MARNDGRVEKGQSIRSAFSAKAWNRAQDAADIVLGVQPGVTVEAVMHERPYNWIRVLNNGGPGAEYTIPRWGPVIISRGLSRDSHYGSDGDFFEEEPLMVGYRTLGPAGNSNLEGAADPVFWGIAIEPIAGGKIGRVAISGVVQCKLNVRSETDTCATIRGADEQNLLTGHSGEAVILHRDAGTGQGKWGLIKFGHHNTLRRASISTTWQYNASRELTDDDGNTFTATNFCQTLTVPLVVGGIQVLTSRWVYCSFVHDSWHLISWQNHLATPASLPQNTAILPV